MDQSTNENLHDIKESCVLVTQWTVEMHLTPKKEVDQNMIKDYQQFIVIMMNMLMVLINLKK